MAYFVVDVAHVLNAHVSKHLLFHYDFLLQRDFHQHQKLVFNLTMSAMAGSEYFQLREYLLVQSKTISYTQNLNGLSRL
jgi:hypothetical protein